MSNRYSRQIAYKNMGEEGQTKLGQSSVVIVGLGGLGSNAANLLARAGIGHLRLVDGDEVEISNLQRQTLFAETDIGRSKAEAAKAHLLNVNSDVEVAAHTKHLDEVNSTELLTVCDLVLDCTDDISTRFVINEFCVKAKKNWVHAAVAGDFGYVKVFWPEQACYGCCTQPEARDMNINEEGVLNTLVASIAGLQVTQASKILLGQDFCEDLIYLNIWQPEMRFVKIAKNPRCPVCAS